MRFDIVVVPAAAADLHRLPAHIRPVVRRAIEAHLRFHPSTTSRSRIKHLRSIGQPQYRLRVGTVPVFYDIVEDTVVILAMVRKADAAAWLAEHGVTE